MTRTIKDDSGDYEIGKMAGFMFYFMDLRFGNIHNYENRLVITSKVRAFREKK